MKLKSFWISVALVILCISGISYAQLQTSGGITISGALPAGTNVIGHVIADSGSTTAVTGNVAVTNSGLTNLDVLLSTRTKPSDQQHAIIDSGTVNTVQKTACGSTVASQALAAVPTSQTAVFTSTTCLQVIVMNNTTGSALTVTVSDNAGTPINDVLTFSIPPNSQLIQPLWGVAFTTGVKWGASGAGVTGAMLGYQ